MTSIEFSAFLKAISSKPLSVLDASIPLDKYCFLDLSKSNAQLQQVDVSSSSALQTYINNQIKNNKSMVAFGGYNETRNIYQRSDYFNQTNPEAERNIHIGLDLWLAADSPVFAPLDAKIQWWHHKSHYSLIIKLLLLVCCRCVISIFLPTGVIIKVISASSKLAGS